MSKLGSGGLLGNSPALNASRQADEEEPQEERPRTSRSSLGAVVAAAGQQPLAGAGGLTGVVVEARQPHAPGSFNKKQQQPL